MAKKQREEPNTSEWMNTYSDLVTLLLCFFVLLFSMSTINAEKWENFVKAFANPGDKTMSWRTRWGNPPPRRAIRCPGPTSSCPRASTSFMNI